MKKNNVFSYKILKDINQRIILIKKTLLWEPKILFWLI